MAKKNKSKNNDAEDMENKLYNLQAQQLAAQVANWAAQLEFQKERLRLLELPQFEQGLQLEVDKLAWQKAEDTWERAFKESSITGQYQGQPTTQWLMDQARLTGSYNGERTLEGKLTDAQIKDMNDKMKLANDQFVSATTGMYNGQKTFDREKFEAVQQLEGFKFLAATTGYHNGQKTFEREQFESGQAMEGWKFLSSLSGPQNAFKQARAIASMPGGMNQLMDAFAGRYMLPASTGVGSGGGGSPLDDMRMGWGGNASGGGGGAGGAGGAGAGGPVMMPGSGSIAPAPAPVSGGPAILPNVPGIQPPPGVAPVTPPVSVPGSPAINPPPFQTTLAAVPGRGFAPSQWNAATQAAVRAWETAYPGYVADGSALGYRPRTASDPPAPVSNVTSGPVVPGGPPVSVVEPTPLPPIVAPPPGQGMVDPWPGSGAFPGGTPVSVVEGTPLPGQGMVDPWPGSGAVSGGAPAVAVDSGQTQAQGMGYSYQPAGVPAPVNEWNYSGTNDGAVGVYPPGVASPLGTPDVSTTTAQNPAVMESVVNANPYQYTPGQDMSQVAAQGQVQGTDPRLAAQNASSGGQIPLPNQIDARNYDNSFQYQKDLMWAGYEDAGWDKGLAQEAFLRSLPRYGGVSKGSVSF